MENTISSLVKNYLLTKENIYFEELLDKFKPLITSYARKLYYLEYEDSVQELSIALYEAIFTIKDSSNEYACISYIQKSIINRFTKLYHKSKEVQKLQSINLAIDENKDLESSYQKTDDCIFKTDLESLLKKRTVLEQKIIYMISQGYTDEEIGRFLGYTRQYINRLKENIKKLILNTKKPMDILQSIRIPTMGSFLCLLFKISAQFIQFVIYRIYYGQFISQL